MNHEILRLSLRVGLLVRCRARAVILSLSRRVAEDLIRCIQPLHSSQRGFVTGPIGVEDLPRLRYAAAKTSGPAFGDT